MLSVTQTQTQDSTEARGKISISAGHRCGRPGNPAPAPPPAVLTVVFTQIPVHGADVQPRRCLTYPWAPLAAGIGGTTLGPSQNAGPIVTRFEYNRLQKYLGEAQCPSELLLQTQSTGVLGAPSHKNFYLLGSDGVLLVTCVLCHLCPL